MGQCLKKSKIQEEEPIKRSQIYKKKIKISNEQIGLKEICTEKLFLNDDIIEEETIKPLKNTIDEFKLLNEVRYEKLSIKSDFVKSIYNNPFGETDDESSLDIKNETQNVENIEKIKSEIKQENEDEIKDEFLTATNVLANEEDEQSIVLVNTDNIVDKILFEHQNDFSKELEKVDEFNDCPKDEPIVAKKGECQYEKVFRDGYDDDLELLNKCAFIKKPTLYFYKGPNNKNEKQIGTTNLVNFLTNKKPRLLRNENPRVEKSKEKSIDSIRKQKQKNSLKNKDCPMMMVNDDDLNVFESIEPLNFTSRNSRNLENEFGDCTKKNEFKLPPIEISPTLGDIAKNVNLSKSKATLRLMSKTVGGRKNKSKNCLTALLDPKKLSKHDNIYQYPINMNYKNNLNRNDSGNFAIDDELNNINENDNQIF
jgi:hypothetical protein